MDDDMPAMGLCGIYWGLLICVPFWGCLIIAVKWMWQ